MHAGPSRLSPPSAGPVCGTDSAVRETEAGAGFYLFAVYPQFDRVSLVFSGLSALRGEGGGNGQCLYAALGVQKSWVFVSSQRTCGAGLKREAISEN